MLYLIILTGSLVKNSTPKCVLFLKAFKLLILTFYRMEKKNNSNLIKSIVLGLIFLAFFLITYYSIYNFEIGMWIKYFGLEFRNVILPALIFFFSGFFVFKIFDSWRNNNIKKIYLVSYFAIIILILLSFFGTYAMRDCSLIQKCSLSELGTTQCGPPRTIGCNIFLFLIVTLGVLSPILAIISLIMLLISKIKKKKHT